MSNAGATRVAYPKPAYASHAEIPDGTLVFKSVVLQTVPFSQVTLWRLVRAGKHPPPVAYAGTRPMWNIDHNRAYAAGTWKPDADATAVAHPKWREA